MQRPLILASSSTTRIELLQRLGLSFEAIAPEIDESARNETHADDLAQRLAFEKARCIALQHPDAIVIGSDQVAWREDAPHEFIGKPMTIENALNQLRAQSGKVVHFSTAFSVQCAALNYADNQIERFSVQFRTLSDTEIQRYIAYDEPLYCAGSFKCESLGISLFERMQGTDMTTLMGLPLIGLCKSLSQLGYALP